MPVRSCSANGKPGYRWGRDGTCYTYTAGNETSRKNAKQKAIKQGIAAGERPAAVDGVELSRDLNAAFDRVERRYLEPLVQRYTIAIRDAGGTAASKFALTAAAGDWQPPVEGAIFTSAELAHLARLTKEKLEPLWTGVILDTAGEPLARVEISWDVKEPLTQRLIDSAGQRVGDRLGEAVRYTLRNTIAEAYNQGLNVRDTAALIKSRISEAAPYQAEMLARSDLNSLSNGASHGAAKRAGMGYKTWLATLDSRTRPEHAEAHGQTVPISDTFTVGGESAAYPGDPFLSDAMAANCRCTLAYGETLDEASALVSSAAVLASR